jgi:hypothetical protein
MILAVDVKSCPVSGNGTAVPNSNLAIPSTHLESKPVPFILMSLF